MSIKEILKTFSWMVFWILVLGTFVISMDNYRVERENRKIVAVEPQITNGDKLRGVVTAVYRIRRQWNTREFLEESKVNLVSNASKICQSWDYKEAQLFSENKNRPGSISCIRKSFADCRTYQYTVNLLCVN